MHDEVKVGGSIIMLADADDEFPAMPSMIHLYVENADAVGRTQFGINPNVWSRPKRIGYDIVHGVKRIKYKVILVK